MEEFRFLGEKVSRVTSSLSDLKSLAGREVSAEDRDEITTRFSQVEAQLRPLIDEALALKEVGRMLKIKILESSADAMHQSLVAVRRKVSTIGR